MKELLKDFDQNKVDIFISYVGNLKTEKDKDGKLKNYWAKDLSDEQYSNAFKKVYEQGLFIDGDSITLLYRKALVITYDYHAYLNKIMMVHPETIFDFQVVYEGDSFAFRKESGKVIYSHSIKDPFGKKKNIIGAYGVIKNNKGEFLELLNMDDITKMKNTSKMSFIWDAWMDRMVLKSVIKRICGVHFKEITKDIDKVDNLQNDPNRATIEQLVLDDIDNCDDIEQLGKIFNSNLGNYTKGEDKKRFIAIVTQRKEEITEGFTA